MYFLSKITPKGNSSYSRFSQEEADTNAEKLDKNNCTNCSNCSDCYDCSRCSGEIIQAGTPNGWRCYGHLKDNKLTIRCGCRTKSASEALAYWANKPNRIEVLAAVKYIINIALLKGWALE